MIFDKRRGGERKREREKITTILPSQCSVEEGRYRRKRVVIPNGAYINVVLYYDSSERGCQLRGEARLNF